MSWKISVIVPVYNVKEYLEDCIMSILNQTYTNFEMVMVDDGSTDGSSEICDKYEVLDPRIRVIHQNNQGLSAARNAGIEIASGDYICFVDSDDIVENDYLNSMIEQATGQQNEVFICGVESTDSNAHSPVGYKEKSETCSRELTKEDAKSWLDNRESFDYGTMVIAMNKLYERHIFEKLRYPVGKIHEDLFIIWDILNSASRIYYINKKLYVHQTRADSITGSDNLSNPAHLDELDAYKYGLVSEWEHGFRESAELCWRNYLNQSRIFYSQFRAVDNKVCKEIKNNYKEVLFRYWKCASMKRRLKYLVYLWVMN